MNTFFIFLVCLLQRIYVFNLHNTSPQLRLCCREFWIICRRPAGHEKMGWHRWSESVLILGGFPGGTRGKEPTPVSAGDIRDASSILGSGRSPGGGHGNHSSILAWRIPWTEEPGRLQSTGSQRIGHDWSNLAHMYKVAFARQLICFCWWTAKVYLVSPVHLGGSTLILGDQRSPLTCDSLWNRKAYMISEKPKTQSFSLIRKPVFHLQLLPEMELFCLMLLVWEAQPNTKR